MRILIVDEAREPVTKNLIRYLDPTSGKGRRADDLQKIWENFQASGAADPMSLLIETATIYQLLEAKHVSQLTAWYMRDE